MSETKTRKCFVVGPIGADDSASRVHADWLLDGVILPVFEAHFKDFDVKRSDRISEPGMIDSQMINRLLDDDLVIADLSELNANAFYEIGIRHMIQKPIIHMFLAGTKIPFDVSPYRAIAFSTARHRDIETAKVALKAAVEHVLSPGHEIENPVTRARGNLRLKENATPEMKIVLERLDRLETQSLYSKPNKYGSSFINFRVSDTTIDLNKKIREGFVRYGFISYNKIGDDIIVSVRSFISANDVADVEKIIAEMGGSHTKIEAVL